MTTTPYSAENVAELALKNGAAFMGDADHMTMHISTLAAIINAALEQQAAARRVLASKPHPTGDTQQKAVRPKFPTMLRKMWSGGEVQDWLDKHDIFTHPPAAIALAQEVRDRVVEIVRKRIGHRLADEISAIPIPESRPDALVAMAYRKAAEVCEDEAFFFVAGDDFKGAHAAKHCAGKVEKLTPPAAQDALEELCLRVIKLYNDDTHVFMPKFNSIMKNELSK